MKSAIIILLGCLISSFTLAGDSAQSMNLKDSSTPKVNTSRAGLDVIGGSVSRAIFTRAVVNREPVDRLTNITNQLRHLYFFTDLKGLTGETVFHRWVFNGNVISEHRFEVGGPRWRVWSNTTLVPEWVGEWKVMVTDVLGQVIREATFLYTSHGIRPLELP